MTCRRVQQLISPYLDRQLTVQQMLDVQNHLSHCHTCGEEYLAVRQVKYLLRSLSAKAPDDALPTTISERLTVSPMLPLFVPNWSARAVHLQRGRRLALALALSCVAILSVAAPFASPTVDAVSPRSSTMALFSEPFMRDTPQSMMPTATLVGVSFGRQGLILREPNWPMRHGLALTDQMPNRPLPAESPLSIAPPVTIADTHSEITLAEDSHPSQMTAP